MKLISVIVPAYNVENHISNCLDSILKQSYKNLEIIVVDDGSTDSTPSIIDSYSRNDKRIKVIHQDNEGVAVARNSGLMAATGDYFGFVDSDDTIEPTMYEEMLAACESFNSPMAITEYREIGGHSNIAYSGKTFLLSQGEALNTFICENTTYRIQFSVWSRLCRKDIVKGLFFTPGKNCEDIMFSTKLMCNSASCVMLDKPLYNYTYDRSSSIMNTQMVNRRLNEELPYLKERIEYFKKLGMIDFHTKAIYYYYRRLLAYYIDFKSKNMHKAANTVAVQIQTNKIQIKEVYSSYFAKKGDQSRLKLFLISPSLFYFVVKMYDRIIVPIKNR